MRRLRPVVSSSDDVGVDEWHKKMELPETTPSVTNDDCQIQGNAKTLGIACVIVTYFILASIRLKLELSSRLPVVPVQQK